MGGSWGSAGWAASCEVALRPKAVPASFWSRGGTFSSGAGGGGPAYFWSGCGAQARVSRLTAAAWRSRPMQRTVDTLVGAVSTGGGELPLGWEQTPSFGAHAYSTHAAERAHPPPAAPRVVALPPAAPHATSAPDHQCHTPKQRRNLGLGT
eukprot:scaffold15442_cov140-Isochrysis_galbana.AAC.1